MTGLEPHYRMVPSDRLPAIRRHPIHVVLDNIRSAFNTGSIFRTADACGIAHVHLCGMTAHPPNVKLAKTALGAFDYVPWTYHARTEDAVAALRMEGIPLVAVEVADTAVPLFGFAWPKPVAIMFGNEVTGISSSLLDCSHAVVRIPMRGFKNTINVATAFGIVAYEIARTYGVAPD